MFAVLKQDIISSDGFVALADCGHIYHLGDIVSVLTMSDITDAGVDATICKVWDNAVMAYRVVHMEINPEWEGCSRFPWEPTVSRAMFVGEAA